MPARYAGGGPKPSIRDMRGIPSPRGGTGTSSQNVGDVPVGSSPDGHPGEAGRGRGKGSAADRAIAAGPRRLLSQPLELTRGRVAAPPCRGSGDQKRSGRAPELRPGDFGQATTGHPRNSAPVRRQSPRPPTGRRPARACIRLRENVQGPGNIHELDAGRGDEEMVFFAGMAWMAASHSRWLKSTAYTVCGHGRRMPTIRQGLISGLPERDSSHEQHIPRPVWSRASPYRIADWLATRLSSCGDTEPDLLFHHSSRVYYFGAGGTTSRTEVRSGDCFMWEPCFTTSALSRPTAALTNERLKSTARTAARRLSARVRYFPSGDRNGVDGDRPAYDARNSGPHASGDRIGHGGGVKWTCSGLTYAEYSPTRTSGRRSGTPSKRPLQGRNHRCFLSGDSAQAGHDLRQCEGKTFLSAKIPVSAAATSAA